MFKLMNIPKNISKRFTSTLSFKNYKGFATNEAHAVPAATESISSRFHNIYIKELRKLKDQS